MASSSTPPPASRWAALPRVVLSSLFTKLGQREVLCGAGLACVAWRRLARDDPALWRRIDLTVPEEEDEDEDDDDAAEDEEEEEEEEENIFPLFDDDVGYAYDGLICWQKTPAKDDHGGSSDDGDESSLFDLFDDGEKTHYAGESDDDFDGDDMDDDMEETPAKQEEEDDDTAEDGGGDVISDDDDDESMHGLFDDVPIDSKETPADDGTVDDDEGEDGTVDDDDETPAEDCGDSSEWKAMALAAIDRSAGQCEAFWGHADDQVLLYLADRASSMKSLRLTSYYYHVSSEVFSEVIKKFPLLEELELVLKYDTYNHSTKSAQRSTNSWVELFQSACKACSHLHSFTVRGAGKEQRSGRYYPRGPRSPKPFSIPMMHGLQSFELSGDSSFTENVVMQIVDMCPNLKSLNITDVRYEDKWELKLLNNKCYRIKDLKLPAVFYEPDTDYSDDDMS
ncbi:unnamed protein product [Urochloa humidicola]